MDMPLEFWGVVLGWGFLCTFVPFMIVAILIVAWIDNKRQQKIIDREFQEWVQYDDYMFNRELAKKTALAKLDIMDRQARRAFVQELTVASKKRRHKLLRNLAVPD